MSDSETPNFLQLTGRGTTALFVLFAIVHTAVGIYGLRSDTVPVLALVSLALILVAGYLMTLDRDDPFPLRLTVLVVALTSVASLNVWNLPDSGWPGWATWGWGAVTFVLFLLTLRGRPGWAWLGFGIMTLLTLVWSVQVGRGVGDGIMFVLRSAVLVLVVWLFSILLSRTRASIRHLQRAELGRVRAEAAAGAALQEQNSRLDQLRASNLATAMVAEAATRARSRGVDVSLLDDRGGADVSPVIRERIETALVEHLDAATSGRIVARLLPDGRDSIATVLASDGDETTRVVINEEAGPPTDASDAPSRGTATAR
jgi:hypothetical protein